MVYISESTPSGAYTFGLGSWERMTMEDLTPKVDYSFKPGDKVEVTLTGVVPNPKGTTIADIDFLFTGELPDANPLKLRSRRVKYLKVLTRAMPKWQAGDVINVQHKPGGKTYTHVHQGDDFNGMLNSSTVQRLWDEGLVKHKMRDGNPV